VTAVADPVLTEQRGRVLVVTLNRPERRNAIDEAAATAIGAALDELDARGDLTIGVLTGAGGTFCAGMDLKAFLAGERPTVAGRGFAGIAERSSEKPLIAAVEGYALAGGFEIALACDLIVAAETATFGLPEVRRGLLAGAGGLFRLPERIPYHHAMELILTGDMLPAPRAAELGLVNRLVAEGAALESALELAERIAENAPLAVRGAKRVVVESRDWPMEEAFERQLPIYEPIRNSEDAREGARAFTEKRPPEWRGR
jgi:enoyl-CoA hydratase/carnithine racemase